MMEINYIDIDNKEYCCKISNFPDFCPVCKRGIEPKFLSAHQIEGSHVTGNKITAIFKCNFQDCKRPFFVHYAESNDRSQFDYFILRKAFTKTYIEEIKFSDEINRVSEKFSKIYNESNQAEENNLLEICGAGYRRALEFLIKDYIVYKKLAPKEEINDKFLGVCIKKYIKDDNIRDLATRAAWLGNDQTHYYQKWIDKDLNDLKILIRLTINWIENDLLTNHYKKSMP